MKTITFVLAIFMANSNISCQEKLSIGILDVGYDSSVYINESNVKNLQTQIEQAFASTKRFKIVDRSIIEAIESEKERQKTMDFIEGEVVEQGVSIGASFLVYSHVTNAGYIKNNRDRGEQGIQTTYIGQVKIDMKVVDVAKGITVCSEVLTLRSHNTFTASLTGASQNPGAAVQKAIQDAYSEIEKFVGRNFPISFEIIKTQTKNKKGRVTQLLVAGGKEFGLQKGDRLFVVEVRTIKVNGEDLERKTQVGELKVLIVEGDHFSTCIVKTGADEITKKMEGNSKLIVTTKN